MMIPSAVNGEEAVKKAENEVYGLIIMDRERFLAEGFNEYFSKPAKVAGFLKTLMLRWYPKSHILVIIPALSKKTRLLLLKNAA